MTQSQKTPLRLPVFLAGVGPLILAQFNLITVTRFRSLIWNQIYIHNFFIDHSMQASRCQPLRSQRLCPQHKFHISSTVGGPSHPASSECTKLHSTNSTALQPCSSNVYGSRVCSSTAIRPWPHGRPQLLLPAGAGAAAACGVSSPTQVDFTQQQPHHQHLHHQQQQHRGVVPTPLHHIPQQQQQQRRDRCVVARSSKAVATGGTPLVQVTVRAGAQQASPHMLPPSMLGVYLQRGTVIAASWQQKQYAGQQGRSSNSTCFG